jgi:hypothetical protein
MDFEVTGVHVAAKSDDFLMAMVQGDALDSPYVVFHKCGAAVAAQLGVPPGSVYFEYGGPDRGGYDLLQSVSAQGPKSWRVVLSAAALERGLPQELNIGYVGGEPLGLRVPAAFKKIAEVLAGA